METFKNLENELLFIASLFEDTTNYLKYHSFIDVNLDFSDEYNKFLYEKFETYYIKFIAGTDNDTIDDRQFTIMVNENEKDKQTFDKIGGFDFINRIVAQVNPKLAEGYFKELKKWTLVRELRHKGFPVEKLVKHKKFEKLTSEQIMNIYHHNLNKISTVVLADDEVENMTDGLYDLAVGCLEHPEIGNKFKFDMYTNYFMGYKEGDVLVEFGYVNTGKSRLDIAEIAYMSLIDNKVVYKLDNEMNIRKSKFALLTTVANDPAFNYNLNIHERDIKLGRYKDEKQKKQLFDIAKMLEDRFKDKLLFKQLYDYSDDILEMEIKKMFLSKKFDVLSYGTLKGLGEKQTDWSALITTTDMLKRLSQQLGFFTQLKAQLDTRSAKLNIFELDEENIAEAKGLIRVVDFGIMHKEIVGDLKDKCYLLDSNKNKISLSKDTRWNGVKIIKNRDGGKGVFAQPYNLDTNVWGQHMYLVNDEKSLKL